MGYPQLEASEDFPLWPAREYHGFGCRRIILAAFTFIFRLIVVSLTEENSGLGESGVPNSIFMPV